MIQHNSTKKLRCVLLLFVIFIPLFSMADQLSEKQVRNAVQTWVRIMTPDAKPDAIIERMQPYIVDGQTVAYIAHIKGGGFCLCGNDDLALPVYLYNPIANYDPNIPDYQTVLDEIQCRLTQLKTAVQQDGIEYLNDHETRSQRSDFWNYLIAGKVPEKIMTAELDADPDFMELNLTSMWNQGSPYNDLLPELIPGQDSTRVVVGCVGTAMAQLMNYWEWPYPPVTGEGSRETYYPRRHISDWIEEPLASDPGDIPSKFNGRLEWTAAAGGKLRMNGYWDISVRDSARGISEDTDYRTALYDLYDRLDDVGTTVSVNFAATTFNWNLINDLHEDPPDTGDAEVAKLCKSTSVASGMRYGVWGSSANANKIEYNMEVYFRYDEDGTGQSWDGSSVDKITADIQWLRPFPLWGCGHAWLGYGYDKSYDPHRRFLMNMGWGPATSHVWYTVDGTSPNWCGSVEGHNTRIAPKNVVKFIGKTSPGDGSPSSPYQNIEQALGDCADGTKLIFRAGSVNTFSGPAPLVIARPLQLLGYNSTLQME